METATPMANPPSTRRRMVIMLLAVGILFGLLTGFNLFRNVMIQRSLQGGHEPPQTVTTAQASRQRWQPALAAVGTVRAVRGADLAFEVAGVVAKLEAVPGSAVRQGQVLVSLNDDAEQAQLRALQAASELARVTFRRAKEQIQARIISQADYDSQEADLKAKEAAVQAQQALIARKHLSAPFPGRVGIISVSPGAYATPGAPVLSLQQLDQVYLDFALPQRDLGRIRPGQKVELSLDAWPGRTFTGKVSAINPKVDGGTRNVQIEATFGNPDAALVPGMFASVRLDVGGEQEYLTLPQTAVTYNPYGSVVYLADQGRAQQVFVTTGPTRGDQVAILGGLKEGAQVVTSGGLKLRNGTPLKIDNTVVPANEPGPAPQEK